MVNDIVDGIVGAIKKVYPAARVHTAQVKQGFTTPCFMVACVNQAVSHSFDEVYKCDFLFTVQYAAVSETDAKEECNEVAAELYECLEVIDVSGRPTRGTRMSANYEGGTLTTVVNYNCYARRPRGRAEDMEVLEHLTEVVK